MAYKNYRKKSYGRGKTTYGKKFRTRAGRYGSYKYLNGRKVGFVSSSKRKSYSRRRY